MGRELISLDGWRLESRDYIDEGGRFEQKITLFFKNIDGNLESRSFDVIATTPHYIAAADFFIKRECDALEGRGACGYMDIHTVLEILENSCG